MTIQKAHISWTATALGASFSAYYVQRLHTAGWFDIARVTAEATVAFDDYEGRRATSESYRVVVQDTLGIRSVPIASQAVTCTSTTMSFVSNEVPALNAEVGVRYPLAVTLPERVNTSPVVGRYGQRLSRSSDQLGEAINLMLNLTSGTSASLWRTIVANLRLSTTSYVCVLDWFGNRWFAGLSPTAVTMPITTMADLAVSLVEVTDTPTVVIA